MTPARLAPPETFDGIILWNGIENGPTVPPGSYRAKLTVGEWTATVPFEVTPDPRVGTPGADLRAQYDFLVGVRDKLSEVHKEIRSIRQISSDLETLEQKAGDEAAASGYLTPKSAVTSSNVAITNLSRIGRSLS